MKPIAWYDPSNGMVSTDQDCPLFTPLGQVWPLYPEREWVGLTRDEILEARWHNKSSYRFARVLEAKLKEKNCEQIQNT